LLIYSNAWLNATANAPASILPRPTVRIAACAPSNSTCYVVSFGAVVLTFLAGTDIDPHYNLF
jgi:hypothetical protein